MKPKDDISIRPDPVKYSAALYHTREVRLRLFSDVSPERRAELYDTISLSAYDQDERIGGVVCWVVAGIGYLEGLWVRDSHQARGISKQLMRAAVYEACQLNCERIVLSIYDGPMLRLCTGLGYAEIFRLPNLTLNKDVVYLVKELKNESKKNLPLESAPG